MAKREDHQAQTETEPGGDSDGPDAPGQLGGHSDTHESQEEEPEGSDRLDEGPAYERRLVHPTSPAPCGPRALARSGPHGSRVALCAGESPDTSSAGRPGIPRT